MKLSKGSNGHSDRQERWKAIIAEQKHSGQSVRSFCQGREVAEQSFYYWRKQLGVEPAPVRFALVETGEPAARDSAALELVLRSGHRLRIGAGVDAAALRTVLRVVEERA
jgi:hypothetical protein